MTTKSTASGRIAAIVEKSMTNNEAESLLLRLTHNSTDERIGNNVTISGNNIYLLHLPKDISSRIPYTLNSDALGEAPDYLSLSGVVGFVVNLILTVANTLYNLATNLIQIGVQMLCGLATGNLEMVVGALNKIADAFNAFVQWAIEFIQDTINSVLSGMIDGLRQLGDAFCAQLLMACNAAASSYSNSNMGTISQEQRQMLMANHGAATSYNAGTITQEQINQIATAVIGTFLITVLSFAYVIFGAIMLTEVVTGGLSFLAGIVLSTLVTFIIVELFMSTIEYLTGGNPFDNFSTFITSLVTGEGGDPNNQALSDAVDIVIGVFEVLSVGISKVSLPGTLFNFPIALAESICGLVMALYATSMASGYGALLFSVLGLELSFDGIMKSYNGASKTLDSNMKIAYGFSGVVSGVGSVWGAKGVTESLLRL